MVRSKAVIALHHFLLTIPESSSHFSSQILPMLGDKYPIVITQVILYLRDLSKVCLLLVKLNHYKIHNNII